MDEQGYVSVELIANFNRVKQITNDIRLVMDAIVDIEELELSSHLV